MSFGERLLELRKVHQLTQQQMGDKLFMDQSTYSRYENGILKASCSLILRVSEEFKVSADWLIRSREPFESGSKPASSQGPV